MKKTKSRGYLGSFVKSSIPDFGVSIFANAVCTLCTTVLPLIISFAIDSVVGNEPVSSGYEGFANALGGIAFIKSNLWIMAVLIAVIAVVNAAFTFVNNYFNRSGNEKMVICMREKLFSHVQRLPLSRGAMNSTGDIIQRCTSDITILSNFISNQLINLLRIIITIAVSMVFMFLLNPVLAGVSCALIVVIVAVSAIFRAVMEKRFKMCDEQEGVLSACAQENLTGVRVVRAFGRERYERDKFEKQNEYYTGLWKKTGVVTAMYWSSTEFLNTVQFLVLMITGTVLCINGTLSAGGFVAFLSYNALLITPLRELGRIISNMSRAGVALGRINEVISVPAEELGEYEGRLSGDIEFKNVSFSFGEGDVLKDVSFKVKEGSVLGVIGGTGSGKSTLAALLSRLYEPTAGDIYIGGRNVKDIPLATLRGNIGLVMQDGYVYSRTVGENIAIASEGAESGDVIGAAKTACVHGAIEGFANGYDTVVGERGVTLSGGQRQRLALARTLLRGTPYFVFDDSLSAVDNETDASIRENLKEKFGGATVIIISHRVTTVMDADEIIVLEDGKIAERGNSARLVANGGIYARIYEMQTALPEELREAGRE